LSARVSHVSPVLWERQGGVFCGARHSQRKTPPCLSKIRRDEGGAPRSGWQSIPRDQDLLPLRSGGRAPGNYLAAKPQIHSKVVVEPTSGRQPTFDFKHS